MPPRKRSDLAPDYLDALTRGQIASSTLVDVLAMDLAALVAHVVPEAACELGPRLQADPALGITRKMALIGQGLYAHLGLERAVLLADSPSDTVRGWLCYVIAAAPDLSLAERLARIRPLADDPHFGVREWAWLALRPHLAAEIPVALSLLTAWTAESSPLLRRFASEATRPRGVWCAHLTVLRRDPTPGLALLEPLRADPVRYVQDSVGNWLNDAAKDHPALVRALTDRWRAESPVAATLAICKRGLRNL